MNKLDLDLMLSILFILEGMIFSIFMFYKSQIVYSIYGLIAIVIGLLFLFRGGKNRTNNRQNEGTIQSI